MPTVHEHLASAREQLDQADRDTGPAGSAPGSVFARTHLVGRAVEDLIAAVSRLAGGPADRVVGSKPSDRRPWAKAPLAPITEELHLHLPDLGADQADNIASCIMRRIERDKPSITPLVELQRRLQAELGALTEHAKLDGSPFDSADFDGYARDCAAARDLAAALESITAVQGVAPMREPELKLHPHPDDQGLPLTGPEIRDHSLPRCKTAVAGHACIYVAGHEGPHHHLLPRCAATAGTWRCVYLAGHDEGENATLHRYRKAGAEDAPHDPDGDA